MAAGKSNKREVMLGERQREVLLGEWQPNSGRSWMPR